MENALISVIVPVYNVAAYLDACVGSLTGQTYKNLEIILIDDGSTDQSGALCDEWEKRDTRIRVVHQKNQGLSAARNRGLEIISGEYVAFLDSDDIIYEDAYRRMVKALERTQADVAICQEVLFYEDGFTFPAYEAVWREKTEDRVQLLKHLTDAWNLDVKNGLIMMVSVLAFTVVGSYVSSLVPAATMGNFSVFMTFLLGIKFIVRPVMTTKEAMQGVSAGKRAVQSVICGVLIGFICGFIGAGGGMMMLLILTSVLGYELKTAVGTSVFIMAFTAFTGAASHFAIGGAPDWTVLILCVLFTLIWARIAAVFANKATPKTLNRATGVILVLLGIVVMLFSAIA